MARRMSSIEERFRSAKDFMTPSIFRARDKEWIVVGLDYPWMGKYFSTFEDAIADVNEKRREHSK